MSSRMGRNPFDKPAGKKSKKAKNTAKPAVAETPLSEDQPTLAQALNVATEERQAMISEQIEAASHEAQPVIAAETMEPVREAASEPKPEPKPEPMPEPKAEPVRIPVEVRTEPKTETRTVERPRVLNQQSAVAPWQVPMVQFQRTMRWAMIDVPAETFMMGLRVQLKAQDMIQNSFLNAMNAGFFGRRQK